MTRDSVTGNQISVAQVSTADVAGGAERVASDLHREYLRLGVEATLIVGFKFSDLPETLLLPNDALRTPWARAWNRLAPPIPAKPAVLSHPSRMLRRACKAIGEPRRALRIARGYDDFDFPATRSIPDMPPRLPHVMHLHNLHGGYFDLRALPELCSRLPVVITAHDMWLATGHCAHAIDCKRWRAECGNCPHLDYPPVARGDKTRENRDAKKALFAKPETRLFLTAPSRWVLATLEESILAPAIIGSRVIVNGVDQNIFRPGDRDAARRALAIPGDAQVVAFTVADADSPYKDFATVRQALSEMARARFGQHGPETPLVFLSIGAEPPEHWSLPGVEVRGIPFTEDASSVARCLQASDVYLHAARAEALGLGILEAQSCGVPVVVTRTGGAPEALADQQTGFVVREQDPEAMAAAAAHLLSDEPLRRHTAVAAAAYAAEHFGLERMARSYLDLYGEAIEVV